jgi:hypothetical protein
MSRVNPVMEVMHRIRVKLYPNNLPTSKGAYIARADSEAMLGIREVGASLVNRGGFTGSHEDLIEHVRLWFEEAMYQLCNGFSINTGFFSIHPSVGGVFDSDKEVHDPQKHPVGFTFRVRGRLRRLVKYITVEIEEIADVTGLIHEFLDVDEEATSTYYVPGDMFVISGHKIKVAGDDPACGVYFVPVDDPSKEVKVERLAENTPTKIIGRAPKTGYQNNRIEVRSQYAGSGGIFLKEPRIITGNFILEEV